MLTNEVGFSRFVRLGTGRFYVNKIWIATTGNLEYKRNIRHMEKTHCCGVNTRESPTARLVCHS